MKGSAEGKRLEVRQAGESLRIFYVGLLHFDSSPGEDVEERLNSLPAFRDHRGEWVKIVAEHVIIHELPYDFHTKYGLVIDRSSHRLSQAVGILKLFAFRGVSVINNPLSFWWFVNSKDAGYGMVSDLGIPVPKTYLLPQHTTPALREEEFVYHRFFDWDVMMRDVGFPCYIKPADGRGAIACNRATSLEELIEYYDESGSRVMVIQQAVQSPYDWHIRCLCLGRRIILMKFIFRKYDLAEYIYERNFLSPELEETVIERARVINRAFGYEMNSVEFVIDHEGKPWAIDFNNPVPDGRQDKLGDDYYQEYVDALAQCAVDKAYWNEQASFLPSLNDYADIARQPMSPQQIFAQALNHATEYYLRQGPPDVETLVADSA